MLWNNEWLVCDCMSTPYIYSSHRYLWLHVVNIDVCDCMSTQIESSQNVWLKLSHFSRPYINTFSLFLLLFSWVFWHKLLYIFIATKSMQKNISIQRAKIIWQPWSQSDSSGNLYTKVFQCDSRPLLREVDLYVYLFIPHLKIPVYK